MIDDDWKLSGACADHEQPDWWTGTDLHERRQAVLICQSCPVQNQCAEHAVNSGVEHGVWGGMWFEGTPKGRRVLDVFVRPEKDCRKCQNRFIPQHSGEEYCSRRCRQEAKNAADRARAKKRNRTSPLTGAHPRHDPSPGAVRVAAKAVARTFAEDMAAAAERLRELEAC